MGFAELLRQILRNHPEGMTPQQLRDVIKAEHPSFYGTESHRRNVEKGHYSPLTMRCWRSSTWQGTLPGLSQIVPKSR